MAGPSADVRLNVSASSAEAALARFSAKFDRMMKQASNSTANVNKKAKGTGNSFDSWAGGIAKSAANIAVMGVGLSAVYGTAQAITAELRDSSDLAVKVNRRQETYQQGLKKFSFSNIPSTVADRDGFLEMVDKGIKSSGVEDQASALEIVRTFMSSMADPVAENRVSAAMDFIDNNKHLINSNDIETASQLASVSAMAQQAFAEMGSTIQAQVGLMNQANNIAATADPNNFGNNIAPTGNKLMRIGANQIETLSLSAAFSSALNDSTGANVDTAITNIVGKLTMAEARFGIDNAGKTLLERQTFIRSNDEKAVRARKYLLGEFANDAATKLTAEQRETFTQAQLNRALLPKLGGRAKTLFAAMDFFQPAGTADGPGSLNTMFRNAIKEMGGVFSAPDRLDVAKTYERAAELQGKLVRNAETNPMFQVANQALDYRTRTEGNLQSQERAKSLFAQITHTNSDYNLFLQSQGIGTTSRIVDTLDAYTVSDNEKELLEIQQHRLMSEYDQRIGRISSFSVGGLKPLDFADQARKQNPELFDDSKENVANNNLIEAIEKLNQELVATRQSLAPQNRQPERPAAASMGR